METCSVVPAIESVDEILWCDHSNETSLAVLLHGTICFPIVCKMKFRILLKFRHLVLLKVMGYRRSITEVLYNTKTTYRRERTQPSYERGTMQLMFFLAHFGNEDMRT